MISMTGSSEDDRKSVCLLFSVRSAPPSLHTQLLRQGWQADTTFFFQLAMAFSLRQTTQQLEAFRIALSLDEINRSCRGFIHAVPFRRLYGHGISSFLTAFCCFFIQCFDDCSVLEELCRYNTDLAVTRMQMPLAWSVTGMRAR